MNFKMLGPTAQVTFHDIFSMQPWRRAVGATYKVCRGNLINNFCFMSLGVDGTVIADLVDFLALSTNLSDSVLLGLLELFNETIHNIDKDNLSPYLLAVVTQT